MCCRAVIVPAVHRAVTRGRDAGRPRGVRSSTMRPRRPVSRTTLAAGSAATAALVAGLTVGGPPASASSPAGVRAQSAATPLDLGPADLTETRSTTTVQPGVTLTRITRGGTDPSLVVDPRVADPVVGPVTRPRRAAAVGLRRGQRAGAGGSPAQQGIRRARRGGPPARDGRRRRRVPGLPGPGRPLRRRRPRPTLRTRGSPPPARPPAASTPAGTATGSGARSLARQRRADRPPTVPGRLAASYGPDLHDRETTSALSRAAGATVGVNAGFFVLDPASGAPGDPAGAGVYDGRLLSEAVGDRPALVLHDDARGTACAGSPGAAPRASAGRRRPRRHQPGAGPDPQLRWRPPPTCRRRCRCTTPRAPTTASWSPSPASTATGRRPARAARSSSTRGTSSAPSSTPGAPPCRRDGRRCRAPARRRSRSPPCGSATGSRCAPASSTAADRRGHVRRDGGQRRAAAAARRPGADHPATRRLRAPR